MTQTNTPTQAAAQQNAPSQPATGLKAFNDLIANPRTQNYLNDVLSEKKASFVNNLVALVTNSDLLQKCEPQSVMFAGIKATALNLPLDPNLGFAYIIPYWDNNKRIQKAQFQMGYRGLLQLAIRSGQMAAINVTDVREGEIIDEDILTGEIKMKKADNRTAKKIVGYAAYMRLTNGFAKTLYSTREEVEAHALRFTKQKTKDGKLANVWASDFDAMAKKTVLKALLKFAPLSTEMAEAIAADNEDADMRVNNTAAAYAPDVTDADAEVMTMDDDEPTEAPTTAQQPTEAPSQPQPNF